MATKQITYRKLQRHRSEFLQDLELNGELNVIDSITGDYMFNVRSAQSLRTYSYNGPSTQSPVWD